MRPIKVLLVDDSAQNRILIRAILEAEKYEVTEASTGREALDIARTQPFDLMVLDLVLPGMDGFGVLSELKRDRRAGGDMPVLVMSSLGDEAARIKALDLGASDFLIRPAGRAEMVVRVRGLIRAKILQERLDDSYSKLTALGRTAEVHLAELNATGSLASDPLPSLVEQVRAASNLGREADLVGAFLKRGDGFDGRVFLGNLEHKRVRVQGVPISRGGGAFTQPDIGIWNRGDDDSPWSFALREGLEPAVGPIESMAFCFAPEVGLAAFNYPGGADAFDAEVVRGFALHWEFVRRTALSAREIEEAFEYTVHALSRAAEANDADVGAHLRRVNEYSAELAGAIGMPAHFVRQIRVQAQLHDVGKIQIPQDLLQKPTDLTPAEMDQLKLHTVYGARILGDHPRLRMAAEIALGHHERWDGSGYPRGLKGEDTPLAGRIVKLADVYDALRSARSYKPALGHRIAVDVITRGDDRLGPHHFDPALLDAFRRITPRFSEIHEQMAEGERQAAG